MFNRFLMTAFIFSQMTILSYGTDIKMLDQEAEKIRNKFLIKRLISDQYSQDNPSEGVTKKLLEEVQKVNSRNQRENDNRSSSVEMIHPESDSDSDNDSSPFPNKNGFNKIIYPKNNF